MKKLILAIILLLTLTACNGKEEINTRRYESVYIVNGMDGAYYQMDQIDYIHIYTDGRIIVKVDNRLEIYPSTYKIVLVEKEGS